MNRFAQRIVAAFNGLAPRERLLIGTAGALLCLALFYLLIASPLLGAARRSEQRLDTAEQQLRVMQRLRRDYDDVSQRLAQVENRIRSGPRGNLRTALETLAGQASVKVETMEPQASPANANYRETKMEVGLRGVTLSQTVDYLQRIESSPQLLSVKTLRLRTRSEKPELLDVTFTVSSFEPL